MTPQAWADVVGFWFDETAPKDWWSASAAMDRRVRERFAPLHAEAAAAPPDPATLDASGHLALVLVLDQFSRHLFRGTAAAFANDTQARTTMVDALDRGLDAALTPPQRQFLYMPAMHGEDAAMQALSLRLFAALGDAAALRSARRHHDVIARFGRFPARNAALGRESTVDEAAFLAKRRER